MSNASGKIKASNMSSTTFDYLDMTRSVQDQINGKHPAVTVSSPLPQSRVDGLANALSGKQPAGSYATTTQLGGYATTGVLSSGLASKQPTGPYATTTQLGGYATTGALSFGLASKQPTGSYATTTQLGGYATTGALSFGLATKQPTVSDAAPIALSNLTGLSTVLAALAGQAAR